MNPKIILAGGSGFLGSLLANHLAADGMEVVILTRNPAEGEGRAGAPLHSAGGRTTPGIIRELRWDGAAVGDWLQELEGARALINLAGVSVNCRYHARNRRLLFDSRLGPTRALGEALARCASPPAVWLNASTATIYKHTFGAAWDEAGEIGGCAEAKDIFSVRLATEWERVFKEAGTPGMRKVALRTAMVLGLARNSVLPNMLRLARLGLAGSMAGGRQFVSWVHQEDFCRAVEWILGHDALSGPVNIASPNSVTNAEFTAAVRQACHAPFGVPLPGWLLEVGAFFMRTETELIIKSRRVVPGKLLASGFTFLHPHLPSTIQQLLNHGPA